MHDWQLSEPCGCLCDAACAAAAGPSHTQQVAPLAAVCGCRRSDAVTTPVAADAPLRHSRFQRVYSNVQYLQFGPAESMVQMHSPIRTQSIQRQRRLPRQVKICYPVHVAGGIGDPDV